MIKNRKGISLIELVLTLALIGIALQVGFSILSVGSTSHGVSTNKGFSQQDIRIGGDFIANELKTVTDISDTEDDYFGTYYSLSVEVDADTGTKRLVKSKLVYTGDGTEEDRSTATTSTREMALSGNWDSIRITNAVMGEVLLEIFQTEGTGNREAHFELPITITTLNKPTLYNDSLDVELVSGDILYYSNNSLNLLTRGIEIGEIPTTPTDVMASFYSEGILLLESTGLPGDELTLPTEPTRDGYSFNGWDPEVPSVFPSSDTTYTAQWAELAEETSTISLYSEGTSYRVINGNVGSSVPSITTPIRDGFSFAGWNPTLPEVFPDEDLRVDATWVEFVKNLSVESVIANNGKSYSLENGAYPVGNNTKIKISISYDYDLPNNRLELTVVGMEGSFSENESEIVLEGRPAINKRDSITVTITIREKANTNNTTSIYISLSNP